MFIRRIKKALPILLAASVPGLLPAQEPYRLGIDEMFELADRNSRSIRTFALAEQEAGQSVKTAKNALLPSVDVSLSASYLGNGWMADRNFSKGMNAPIPHFGNNFAIEASQVIYAGGALSSGLEVARLQMQTAELDKELNRQDIRFLLTGNYLELYKLHNQSEVYRKNIGQTERLLADIRAKQQQGLALKNDITRYELQLQSLELALTQIENSKIILNDELATILGLPEQTVIAVDTAILDRLPQTDTETQWQQSATETAPALKQAQLGVAQSEHGVKIARAERLPSIALFAGDRLDGPVTFEIPPLDRNFNYWYAGVGLKFNIASTYKSRHKVNRAKIAVQRAAENERLLRDRIRTEVKAAYVRFVESFTIHETQLKSLELANQNYDVIRNRYLNDLALITDMLDASNSKLSAELQVANARINILFNYYRLKKAAGDL